MNNVTRIGQRKADEYTWGSREVLQCRLDYERRVLDLAELMAKIEAKDAKERRQMLYNCIGFAVYLGVCAGGVIAWVNGWIG